MCIQREIVGQQKSPWLIVLVLFLSACSASDINQAPEGGSSSSQMISDSSSRDASDEASSVSSVSSDPVQHSSVASSLDAPPEEVYNLPVRWRAEFKQDGGQILSENNISGYRLAYKLADASSFEEVDVGDTRYYLAQSLSGGQWQFKVAAFDQSGGLSQYSELMSVILGATDSVSNPPHRYSGTEVHVSTVGELLSALDDANNNGGNTQIIVAAGTYTVNRTLNISADHIVIRSASGDRASVIIEGDEMSPTADVKNLIYVTGDHFVLDGVTLQKSRYHLIQVAGERDADHPIIRNCHLRDGYEQLLKITRGDDLSTRSDNGLIENCYFEYTAGIGPNYYIGGVDGHGNKGWTIRNNTFKNIASPGRFVAEHAIHLWNGTEDNIVENNTIIDCDRGIGFGMRATGKIGNTGGIIRNNFIYHSGNAAHEFADTGIVLEQSTDTKVFNNTVILKSGFNWNIEYRWLETTGVEIYNNLTNGPIRQRNDGQAVLDTNITDIDDEVFSLLEAGDLHLNAAVIGIVDAGKDIANLNDIDGQARTGNDIGADEFRF